MTGFLTLASTQFVVVGLVAVSFHVLNNKLNAVSESLRRLDSKFDDQRWAIIAGAIDQLRRIEREGKASSIWNDLMGVRKELSAAAAYHYRRLTPLLDEFEKPYADFNLQKFRGESTAAIADLVALAMSRSSLGRACLMEEAHKSAHHEMVQAQEEVHRAVSAFAKGLLHYTVKQNKRWFGKSDHARLVEHVGTSIDSLGSIGALEALAVELGRPAAWYDSSLSLAIRSAWKDTHIADDAEFLLNLDSEASAREASYRVCLENHLSPDSYLEFISQQRLPSNPE